MAYVRDYNYWGGHANPIIYYDNADTKDLYHNVQTMDYTDYAEGSSDEIVINLTDQKRTWLNGWFPEKGHLLNVYIDYYNWFLLCTLAKFHCGNFIVDDIDLSGPAHSMTVRGVSQPAGTDFKETPRYKTWQNITIKQIAQELMTKYGMNELYFYGDETVIEELEQDGESDCEFIERVCERYGYSLKIYMVGFVIYKKSIYEPRGVVRTFKSEFEFDDWAYNSTLLGTYTGAKISYSNPKKGKEDDDIEITVGTEGRLLIINERADSEAEAIDIAKNQVNKANESAETIEFTLRFDPKLVASSNIELKGIHDKVDGKYFISKVKTSLSKSGTKMKVSAYKIQQRI